MSQRRKQFIGWLWPGLLAISITLVSGTSELAVPQSPLFSSDKLVHFLVFGLVSTAIIRNFPKETKDIIPILIAGILTSLFGMTDEIRQSFTPGRVLDIWDWLADTSGAFIAAIAYRHVHLYRRILEWRILPQRRKEHRELSE